MRRFNKNPIMSIKCIIMQYKKIKLTYCLFLKSLIICLFLYMFTLCNVSNAEATYRLAENDLIQMAINYFSLVQGTSVVEFSEVMLSLNAPPSDLAKITWVCSKKEHVLLALSETDRVIYGGWMVATGRNPGQKLKVGDMRTPEGVFYVKSIEDSSVWGSYVDKATKERIGYGPYFIRLEAGWKGIGIHGTDDEHLHEIGTDASHGCIRMANDDLLEVVSMSMKGQKVVILESLN